MMKLIAEFLDYLDVQEVLKLTSQAVTTHQFSIAFFTNIDGLV